MMPWICEGCGRYQGGYPTKNHLCPTCESVGTILPVTEKRYFCPLCQSWHNNNSKIGIRHLMQSHQQIPVNRARRIKGYPDLRHSHKEIDWALGLRSSEGKPSSTLKEKDP